MLSPPTAATAKITTTHLTFATALAPKNNL